MQNPAELFFQTALLASHKIQKRIVIFPTSFGFHGNLEAVGKIFLAESYITKFSATFLYWFPQF